MKQRNINLVGWLVALAATGIYLLTLDPSVSFWDCGEFIATSYKLQVGHPPGAPTYQLIAHCFTLLAGSNVQRVAWWSNALSALSGGLTAMFLFWTLLRLLAALSPAGTPRQRCLAALVGSACFTLCDTAWFSAVESEVYSLAMLFAAVLLWAMLRWAQEAEPRRQPRWLLLIALLLGLSVGVHQLCLLTLPALIVIYIVRIRRDRSRALALRHLVPLLFLFIIGLSTYAIIPLRANANPPINMGNPSNLQSFKTYINRDQYEKAPLLYGRCFNSPIVDYRDGKPVYAKEMDMLLPRMWKRSPHAEDYYTDWTGRHGHMVAVGDREYYKPSQLDNLIILGGYQVGYMYLRYLMWNFAGRYDDHQGFGNLQHGQFLTGIPPLDRQLVGSGRPLPPSLHNAGHNRYFLLPLLLGIVGLFSHRRRHKAGFRAVMTLFLMGSLMLSLYLNHPLYEPRERDYAYILSFYAFALWIGVGAHTLLSRPVKGTEPTPLRRTVRTALLLALPLLMAFQNWDDHNRSHNFVPRDSAANLLNSCPQDAILFTSGDNDTFPLWYMQQVEALRTDVQVVNLSLLGSTDYAARYFAHSDSDDWQQMGPYGRFQLLVDQHSEQPLMFSRYARDAQRDRLGHRLQPCGIAYRLDAPFDPNPILALQWHDVQRTYLNETSRSFLTQYWEAVLAAADSLIANAEQPTARRLLDQATAQVPLDLLQSLPLRYEAALRYHAAGDTQQSTQMLRSLRNDLAEQLDYYGNMSTVHQRMIPYTLQPLLTLDSALQP